MSSTYYNHRNTFDAFPRPSDLSSAFNRQLDPVIQKHLRRVYTSLATALCAATLGSILTLQCYLRRHFWPSTLASYLTLPILFLFYYQGPHSKWRSTVFHAFAFADGAAAAPLLSLVAAVNPRIPVIAFMGASAVFACCSISAIFARRGSYLFLGSICSTSLFGLMFIGLISSIWSSLASFSLIIYGGLLAFVGFVLYDTQVIIEKAHNGERDHLQHALELLIDFIAIFKRLAIVIAKNQARRQSDEENDRRRRCSQ